MSVDLSPGSPEWRLRITSSKVPTILGASPYSTPAEVWAQMRGDIEPRQIAKELQIRGETDEVKAVRYLWEVLHPSWTKEADGHLWLNDDHPWAAANTDSHGVDEWGRRIIVEAKSVGRNSKLDEWGQEGTDQVPFQHWLQVLFQMWLTGIDRTHVVRVGPYTDEVRVYVVDYSKQHGEALADKLHAFYLTLTDDDACPEPSSPADRAVFSRIYTRIDDPDDEWEVAPTLRERFEKAHPEAKRWADELNLVKAELLAAMGNARYATVDGVRFARRQKSGPGMALYPHIDRRESVNESAA